MTNEDAKDINVSNQNGDVICRKDAIDALMDEFKRVPTNAIRAKTRLEGLPSVQPEIIRCKDCKWWDKYSDTRGYCLAAKHGHWSEHWDISIRRTYDADWYCADAERREDKQDETD